MKKNTVRAKLKAGQPSVGTWISLASNIVAEYLTHSGWDWLCVDTEHSPVGFEQTVACFQAICTSGTIPMARVAWNDHVLIKRLLDNGAMGIVVPMVNTKEEAEKAAGAMRYPPEGYRSVGSGRASAYGDDYVTAANKEILCVVQVESMESVNNAEAIMSVEGVDACFIGPNDLAASMGIPYGKASQHPEHEAAMMKVLEACKKVGKAAGIHAMSPEDVNRRVEQGFQFVACGSDAKFLRDAVKGAVSKIKALGGGGAEAKSAALY